MSKEIKKVQKEFKEKDRKELAKEFNEKLTELNEVEKLKDLLKDNKVEFEIDKIIYRVRKANYRETLKCNNQKIQKQMELLENPKYKLRKELIRLYKKNGIDIEKLEAKINSFNIEVESLQEKLAVTTIPSDMKLLEDEITKLKRNQIELILEKNEYLEGCIENQIIEHANLYMVYLVTEKKVDDKWIKAFDSFEEFMDNDKIIIQATNYLSLLVYHQKIQ
jgi:hypothetical protein